MLEVQRLGRILEVARAIASELDLEAILRLVTEEGRQLTGATSVTLGATGDSEVLHGALTVPVLVHGEVYGNLCLAEKSGGAPFDADDEEAIELLAGWAGVAIANAGTYRAERELRRASQQAVRALEATTAIARAVGAETDLDRVLELIVERARDRRFALAQRVGARSALFVPLVCRGRSVGVLNAFDPAQGAQFTPEDERLLESFAASAATAVATAQSVAQEGLGRSLEASERERQRWARELHDETLQELAALKVLLSAARSNSDRAVVDRTLDLAFDHIDTEITGLRRMIADLRPAELDAFGVKSALSGLAERVAGTSGLEIELDVDLAYESGRTDRRPDPAIEDAVYRLVQESLTNAVKHAEATRVTIEVAEAAGAISFSLEDDGRGFAVGDPSTGFGLVGMRERVALLRGDIAITSEPGGGTRIAVSIPVPPGDVTA